MSEGMNQVILMGHLGAEPELRTLPSGTSLLKLRMATNETYLDRNKERQERTDWHDVVLWGPRAEALSRILTKGSGLVVEGSIRTSSYEKDGVRRWRTEILARDVHLLARSRRQESPSTGSYEAGTAPSFGAEAMA